MTYAGSVGNMNTTVDYTKLLERMYAQQQAKATQGTVATNPVSTSNTIAEDTYVPSKQSTETCTDGKDDGKIGFWSAVGNTVKGVGKTLWNGLKGMVTNKEGKFSLGKTIASVGAAALCIAFPAVGLVACAVGGVMGAVQVGKGIYNAATAETDAEAKQAWQDIGGGTFTVVTSAVGAKASLGAVKATSSAGGAKGLSALDKLDDVAKVTGQKATLGQKTVALAKDMGSSTINRGKTIGQTASALSKQHQMNKATRQANSAKTKATNAQENGAKNADTLQNKANSAQAKADSAKQTYDDYLNSHETAKTNVEKINGKIESGRKQIEAKVSKKTNVGETDYKAARRELHNKYQNATSETERTAIHEELAKLSNEHKNKIVQVDSTKTGVLAIEGEVAKTGKIATLVKGIKNIPSKTFKTLSTAGQEAYKFLTSTEGNYAKAVQQFGYDAVYEVLAVVESYSLADQSV